MSTANVTGPRGRNHHIRAVGPRILLCAMALGVLLVSPASAQVVEGYIQLPDSFGVFGPPYQVTVDYTPGAERLFVIGESSDVLVIDAINLRKLARIPGPANSLCYSSTHNKLYVAQQGGCTVVDGSTYQVIKHLQFGDIAGWLFYNPIVDRVYCGTYHWRIIDCDSDSVVDMIEMDGWGACRAFDSLHNKLYVGTGLALKVVDCYSDSVVAAVSRVRGATAICYNPTSDRVYATANTGGTSPDETLYVVDTETDSVVAQLPMPGRPHPFNPTFTMCCDPVRNRVFTACTAFVAGMDCAGDTLMWCRTLYDPSGLASAPDQNKAYVATPHVVFSLAGATGQENDRRVPTDGCAAPPVYLSRLSRLYCTAIWGQIAAIDCSIDTLLGQVPLSAFVDASAERVCVDTVDNKLYFAFSEYCGYLGVADCSARLAESHQMCKHPEDMVHDALDDKLYVSTHGVDRNGVSVFDCKNDSLIKFVHTGYVRGICWHPELNKVYAGVADDSIEQDYVAVVDCATDSVVRSLRRDSAGGAFWFALLSPELDQFWGFSPHGYTVVDCLKDSIVMDTITGNWDPRGACYSAAERKVYVLHGSKELIVLSMESLRPTLRIHLTERGHAVDAMIHVAAAGKVYVAVMNGPSDTDSIYVVDTGTDSVVSRFDAGHIIRAMCEDATGRYVYCTALTAIPPGPVILLVIDTQSDSVVSEMSLPEMTEGSGEWLLPNRRTGRIYVGQGRNGRLLVIRDSVVIGLEESGHTTSGSAIQQTVASRSVPLRSAMSADLFDASGRRVAILRSGWNDISHLAPGVYFVREEPQASSLKPQAVRKTVITR